MFVLDKLGAPVGATALATLLAVTPAFAQDTAQAPTSDTNATVSESVQDEATAKVDEKRKALIEDATLALEKTEEALTALDDDDRQGALDALAIATGKLQSVVARDPDLALAPVDVTLIRRDLLGDVETIDKAREAIEDLVDDGRLQQARPLLRDFASELIVETTNLPLATYPAAILRATAQIDDDEIEKAKQTLATALSTMVITEDVIALPVLRAELLIGAAEAALGEDDATAPESESTETGSADAETNGEMADPEPLSPGAYVEAARNQLRIAEALGYGDEDDFEELHENLERLDEQIDAQEDTGGILDTIRESFGRLKERFVETESK